MYLERWQKCFSNNKATIRHQDIELAAYLKAESAGFPPGREIDFWIEAEREYDEKEREKPTISKSSFWDEFMYKIGLRLCTKLASK